MLYIFKIDKRIDNLFKNNNTMLILLPIAHLNRAKYHRRRTQVIKSMDFLKSILPLMQKLMAEKHDDDNRAVNHMTSHHHEEPVTQMSRNEA